jgi:hypothetical protein
MGNAGWNHVCFDVLPEDVSRRPEASESFVDEGNFLLFAIACQWLSRLTYVVHPEAPMLDGLPNDLLGVLFRDFDRKSGVIELPGFAETDRHEEVTDGRVAPTFRDPPVMFDAVGLDDFQATGEFAAASLSMSPLYTSPATDGLVEVFARYIDFEHGATTDGDSSIAGHQ